MQYSTTTVVATTLILAISIPVLVSDYRVQRIPNSLVLLGVCSGLLLQLSTYGSPGVLLAAGGFIVGTLCLLPFYVAGATGAGDVKFLGAMGAVLGPVSVIIAFILTLFVGSLLAVASITWSRVEARCGPGDVGSAARLNAISRATTIGPDNKMRIPYAAAICAGSLATPWVLGGLDALVPLKLF